MFDFVEKHNSGHEVHTLRVDMVGMNYFQLNTYTQYGPITNVGIFPELGVLYFYPDFQC